MNKSPDQILIDNLGGCAAVARLLGLENPKTSGTIKVYSWYRRTRIPARWKVRRPDLFMMEQINANPAVITHLLK